MVMYIKQKKFSNFIEFSTCGISLSQFSEFFF